MPRAYQSSDSPAEDPLRAFDVVCMWWAPAYPNPVAS